MSLPQTLRLSDRAVIDVHGVEARPFLNRLLTQDVESLRPGELRYAALLTPQGRVLHDVFLFGETERVRIDVAADRCEDLMHRLAAFKLRAAVEMGASAESVHALWGTGRAAEDWRPDPRTPLGGFRWVGPGDPPAGDARAAPPSAYERHRLGLGLPDIAQDGLSDRVYATEANLDLLNGVDFGKGCFVGQETTSRMKRRNGMRSRVLPLEVDGAWPAPGAEVLTGELRAGEVVATGACGVLALLRLDRARGRLTVAGAPAAIAWPPWAVSVADVALGRPEGAMT